MYSNGPICLFKLLLKMGLFTVWEATIKLYLGTSSTYFTENMYVASYYLTKIGWVFLMGEAAALKCMEIYIACLYLGQIQIINVCGTVFTKYWKGFLMLHIVKLFLFSLNTLSPHLTVWKFSTWRDWTPSLPATTGSPAHSELYNAWKND